MRSEADDKQGMAAQLKQVWTLDTFSFFYRLNGVSDFKIFRLYKHIKYVLMNLEITVSIKFCIRIQNYRPAKHRMRWLVLHFLSFSPY